MTTSLVKHLYRGYKRGASVFGTTQRSVTSLTSVLSTVRARETFASVQRCGQIGSLVGQQTRRFSGMPRPIVYVAYPSPPSRAVLLTAAALGLDVDEKLVDLAAGEHHSKEFKAMNPEHTVPTINDDGFILWESHAIMCYFVDKYAKDDSLYPKDLRRRALVQQRLHFDSGVLFARLRLIAFPLIMGQTTTVPTEKLELLQEAYTHLNNFLEGKQWLVGDTYTVADISCVTTLSSIQCVLPIDDYPNIKAWLKRCADTLPGYEAHNTPGCKMFHKLITSKITSKGKL